MSVSTYLSCLHAIETIHNLWYELMEKIHAVHKIFNTYIINKTYTIIFNKETAMMTAAILRSNRNFKCRLSANTILPTFQLKWSMKLSICHRWYWQQTPIGLRCHRLRFLYTQQKYWDEKKTQKINCCNDKLRCIEIVHYSNLYKFVYARINWILRSSNKNYDVYVWCRR